MLEGSSSTHFMIHKAQWRNKYVVWVLAKAHPLKYKDKEKYSFVRSSVYRLTFTRAL